MLAPWKKSYDQPRQHIKKQRHYFADRGPYSQIYVFFFCSHSSSYKKYILGTSLVVQWLRICVAMQGRQILFLVRELRSHMPREQLNPSATITEPTGSGAHAPQPKTPHDSAMISCAVTKTQHSQLNK